MDPLNGRRRQSSSRVPTSVTFQDNPAFIPFDEFTSSTSFSPTTFTNPTILPTRVDSVTSITLPPASRSSSLNRTIVNAGKRTSKNWSKVREYVLTSAQQEPSTPTTPSTPSTPTPRTTHSTPSTFPARASPRQKSNLSNIPGSSRSSPRLAFAALKSSGSNSPRVAAATLPAAARTLATNAESTFVVLSRNVLRFKTAVEQKTDVWKMEKEIERLLISYHSGTSASFAAVSYGTLGNTVGSAVSSASAAVAAGSSASLGTRRHRRGESGPGENAVPEESEQHRFYKELLELLKKWKHVVKLPMLQAVLAELGKPFLAFQINEEDCEQALDIFEYIRVNYKPGDADENFSHILWCCKALEARDTKMRLRICALLKLLLMPSSTNTRSLPQTITAVHTLVYSFVHTLATLQNSNTSTADADELANLERNIRGFLDQLSRGDIIPVAPDAYDFLDGAAGDLPRRKLNLCVFLEGLVKCMLVRDARMRKLVVTDLLKTYWMQPDERTQTAYEHIVFLFAEAVTETLSDSYSTIIDPENPRDSIPYLLLFHLHTNLPPSSFASTKPQVISAVVAAVFAVFSVVHENDPLDSFPEGKRRGRRRRRPTRPASPSSPGGNISPRTSSAELSGGESDEEGVRVIDWAVKAKTMDDEVMKMAKIYLEGLWNDGFKDEVVDLVNETLEEDDIDRIIRIYFHVVFGINDLIGAEIVKRTIDNFFKKLTTDQPDPSPSLTNLLLALSTTYRPLFYKPILACVASDSIERIAQNLTLITCLQQYMSSVQLWMQDPEMMCVIVLSDVGEKNKDRGSRLDVGFSTAEAAVDGEVEWGSTTLGQCIILLEFVWAIRQLRTRQSNLSKNADEDEVAKKFLNDLERRIAIFMAAKEKIRMIPLPLRALIANLFLEIRFFCSTTHRPGWLSRVIDWTVHAVTTAEFYRDASKQRNARGASTLVRSYLDDVALMFQKMRIVYATLDNDNEEEFELQEEVMDRPVSMMPQKKLVIAPANENGFVKNNRTKISPLRRRATIAATTKPRSAGDTQASSPATSGLLSSQPKGRLLRLTEINQDPYGSVLSLLVAVYTTLTAQEFAKLAPHLWNRFVDDRQKAFSPGAFLFIQCGERVPKVTKELISQDLYSPDPMLRMASLRKLASLFGHRFNILAQDYIPDNSSNGRRLFRTGAVVIPFVATDLGTNKFTLDEPRWMAKLKHAGAFPIEMKKQIQELGWDDDNQVEEHDQLRRELTPLSLLPTFYLDEEDEDAAEEQGTGAQNPTIVAAIAALNARKRTATVPSLSLASLGMIDLLNDVHGGVFNTVRELVSYILRDDPALFLRVFLGDIGKPELDRQKELLTRLRYLVAMQSKFPPNFTHLLFNHLAGLLKWYARDSKEGGLTMMMLAHPLLSELVLSTNELSVRDLRKNKIEYLLCSTGQFWFTDGQPLTMFPRNLSNPTCQFNVIDVPLQLFETAMLRISHLHFITNYISRYPREVYAVKKTFHEYEPMPTGGMDSAMSSLTELPEDVYIPDLNIKKNGRGIAIGKPLPSRREHDTYVLSALRARVWLNFVDTLLAGLNRNYNDRSDLERIVRGVNQIILSHRSDFGLIGKAMILYVRIITRFRRLFSSNRGYALFLPAVFRIFCEAENIPAIRAAITSAWSRFFAVHEESFVFQALGSITPLVLKAYQKSNELGAWMSDNLYYLIKTLSAPTKYGSSIDVLGLQLQMEIDDRAVIIQEHEEAAHRSTATPLSDKLLKPLTPLTKVASIPVAALLPVPISNKTFSLEDSVKLFLTIIAYDTGSSRAEQFVKMLRHLLFYFMNESPVRDLLDQGIVALIDVFLKFSRTAKPTTSAGLAPSGPSTSPEPNITDGILGGATRTESTQQAYGKQWAQNNRLTIKQEFVRLIQVYCKNGGVLSDVYHDRMAQVVKNVIKDYATLRVICPTKWIKDYVVDVISKRGDLAEGRKAMVALLNHIQQQYRSQWKNIDAADMYEGFAMVMERSHGRTALTLDVAHILQDKFVEHGLSIAVRSDWEDEGSRQSRFCNSLVRLIVSLMEYTPLDMVADIERHPPTAALVAYVVIPICIQYSLKGEYQSVRTLAENRCIDPTSNWMRLLAYITKACSKASLIQAKENGNNFTLTPTGANGLEVPNPEKSKRTSVQPITIASSMFIMSFTALKIVLVRGSRSLDKSKGAWLHVANFAMSSLIMGHNLGILKGLPPSTTPSSNPSTHEHDYFTSSPVRASFEPRRTSSYPPAGSSILSTPIDFATWSFLEFVVCYKSPLVLHMRTFIHQRLHDGGNAQSRASILMEYQRARTSVAGPSSSSPPNETSRRSKWRSWGGLAAIEQSQQHIYTSSPEREAPASSPSSPAIGQGLTISSGLTPAVSTGEINPARSSSLPDSYQIRSSSLAASSTRTASTLQLKQQNLYLETVNAIANVQLSLGYHIPESQARVMSRPWTYHQAMDRLIKEWKMVMQSYPDVFIVDRHVEVVAEGPV